MIAHIKGTLEGVSPSFIIVDVNGIGYEIFCPNPFRFQGEVGKTIKVYTYQHVREDVLALYGFVTETEKQLFIKLLNVSGIGPKGGLAILASGQPEHVVEAIETEDETYLTRFPGVGKKTARQIILDLKGKLVELVPVNKEGLSFSSYLAKQPTEQDSSDLNEAVEALRVLGYAEREIKKVLPVLKEEVLSTDQYVKKALQYLLSGSRGQR